MNWLDRIVNSVREHRFIVLATVVFLFVTIVTLSLFLLRTKSSAVLPKQKSTSPSAQFRSLPKVNFASYDFQTGKPVVPDSLNAYTLKTEFAASDAVGLAQKAGLVNGELKEMGKTLVSVVDKQTGGMVTFDKKNGNFFIYLSSGHSGSYSTDPDPSVAAKGYLQETGIADGTVDCTSWYRRQSVEGVTFVECHRNWGRLGSLPILNMLGIFNLPTGKRLDTLKIAEVEETAQADPDITETSDGKPGKARPDNFNTIVVALSTADHSVNAVTSNMRTIVAEEKKKTVSIKTPDEAIVEIQNGGSVLSLTKPSGAGLVPDEMVYKDNRVAAKTATVTDYILFYLEKSSDESQKTLEPYYLIKGTATAQTGFGVDFIQIVPALKGSAGVLGVSTKNSASTIQYSTVDFGRSSPTPSPTIPPPTIFIPSPTQQPTLPPPTQTLIPTVPPPTTTPPATDECPELKYEYPLPGGARLGIWFPPPDSVGLARVYYYIPANQNDPDLIKERENLNNYLQKNGIGSGKYIVAFCQPLDNSICNVSQPKKAKYCIQFGLVSPNLYLYAKRPQTVSVMVPKDVVRYTDPAFTDWSKQMWQLRADDSQKRKLFYLYDRLAAEPIIAATEDSNEGYIVSKKDIESVLRADLFAQLGLTKQEQSDFMADIQREVGQVAGDYVKLQLVNKQIINQFLPLYFTPVPDHLYRIHLLIQSATASQMMHKPSVNPIERDGYTVVETGVIR